MGNGTKFDGDKARLDLIIPEFVEALGTVLTQGAEVHGDNNWKDVDDAERRYYAALYRHLMKYKKGQTVDDESGESHLAHIACNAMFLLWFEQKTKKNNVKGMTELLISKIDVPLHSTLIFDEVEQDPHTGPGTPVIGPKPLSYAEAMKLGKTLAKEAPTAPPEKVKLKIPNIIGKSGLFWDSDKSNAYFCTLTHVRKSSIFPFINQRGSYKYFYLAEKPIENFGSIIPAKKNLYTRSDL